MGTSSKEKKVAQYTTMITGINENVGANETVGVDGVPTGKTALVGALQAFIDAEAKVVATRASHHEAIVAQKGVIAPAAATYIGVKSFATANYAKQPTKLASFGVEPKARQVPNVSTKAEAIQKRDATREARGTKGKRQKAKITGETAAAAATTPPAAPAAPPATPAKS
jgi:hypothetical protein